MSRLSRPSVPAPGLPLSLLLPRRLQRGSASIWQLSALIATAALIVFLLLRAVRLASLQAAPPPVVAPAAATMPQPAAALPGETPASAWPQASAQPMSGGGKRHHHTHGVQAQGEYRDSEPTDPGYPPPNYSPPDISSNNAYPADQESDSDDSANDSSGDTPAETPELHHYAHAHHGN